ncbi:hypothetical protein ANN_00306 [Periplaneta americana]|uniref:Gustatory receptor n=1 Tax=Periplaneta americana TaxID=6978 RepID=A0ABQ8TQG3_PERAM|nr:hypothetical protein ANN_00306 [Periplaneta americana]
MRSGYLRNVFEKCLQIDARIDIMQQNQMYIRTRSRLVGDMIIACLILLVVYVLNYHYNMDGKVATILSRTVDNLCITFGGLLTLQFTTLVRALQQRYQHFNEEILRYFKLKSSDNLPRYLENSEVTFINRNKYLTTGAEIDEVHKLRSIRLMHFELYDCVVLINDYYGLPILLFIISSTISCVACLYYAVHFIGLNYIFFIFPGIFFTTSYVTIFVLITTCCHQTAQEANKTAMYVQRIKALPGLQCRTVLELQNLSEQLREMRIEFSAWGFFRLDLSFLSTIIGGVITYILVMIQLN